MPSSSAAERFRARHYGRSTLRSDVRRHCGEAAHDRMRGDPRRKYRSAQSLRHGPAPLPQAAPARSASWPNVQAAMLPRPRCQALCVFGSAAGTVILGRGQFRRSQSGHMTVDGTHDHIPCEVPLPIGTTTIGSPGFEQQHLNSANADVTYRQAAFPHFTRLIEAGIRRNRYVRAVDPVGCRSGRGRGTGRRSRGDVTNPGRAGCVGQRNTQKVHTVLRGDPCLWPGNCIQFFAWTESE